VRIEAIAFLRIVRAVHPIAIELAGRDVAEIAMPDVFGTFGEGNSLQFAPALAVEQAELDLCRRGGE